jgi:hypothetical protein
MSRGAFKWAFIIFYLNGRRGKKSLPVKPSVLAAGENSTHLFLYPSRVNANVTCLLFSYTSDILKLIQMVEDLFSPGECQL